MDYLEKAKRVLDLEIRKLERLRQRPGDKFPPAGALIKKYGERGGENSGVGVVFGRDKTGGRGGRAVMAWGTAGMVAFGATTAIASRGRISWWTRISRLRPIFPPG